MHGLRLATLVALTFFAACGLSGSPEGHYAIDRKLTSEAIDRYARQQLAEIVVQVRGKNAEVSDEELARMKEGTQSMVDKMVVDLNLDQGGKFRGSSTIEGQTETSEGTWALRGETLEITETSENGKPRAKPKSEVFHYSNGLLSFSDTKENPPFIILSRP